MNPFVQSPCQRCGATVWIPTATGFAYCPQCNPPAQMQPGAAQAQAPSSAQGGQAAIAATVAIPQMATPPGGAAAWGAPPTPVAATPVLPKFNGFLAAAKAAAPPAASAKALAKVLY